MSSFLQHRWLGAALLVLVAWLPARTHAQIHNVQSILATEAEEGLSGTITASADVRSGNVSYLFVSATPVARYRKGNHLGIAIVRADHKTSGDDVILSRFFEHVRYRYQLTERLLGEAFVQPRLDDARDYRVLNESQLVVQATKALSFTTAFSVFYDSRPPESIKKLDSALTSSITVEL